MLIAIVVGTVLAFGWGAVSWTTGIYDFAIKPLPGGDGLAAAGTAVWHPEAARCAA